MLARARLDGTETATVHVPYLVTREQLAALLLYSTRWRPGVTPRYGLMCAADVLRADPEATDRPLPPPEDPRYSAALADVDRWGVFGRSRLLA